MTPELFIIAGTAILGSGGAAWAGTKASLNGTRERVSRIESKQDTMIETVADMKASVARIEERTRAEP